MRTRILFTALAGATLSTAAMAGTPPDAPPVGASHRPAHAAPASLLPRATPMPQAAAGIAKAYGGAPIDVTTYHYDNNRTGWNPAETDLTPATVASPKFGLLTTLAVDGNVLAQPLLVSGFPVNGAVHDILIIATGHNSVYAYDAQTYAILWQVNLGPPQPTGYVQCADVVPEYGISSTPVIVRSGPGSATLYVVSAVAPPSAPLKTYLNALNLATGQAVSPAVEIAPTAKLKNGATLGFDPQNQWSRAGLAFNNGSIYMGIGSHCDNNAYGISGWLLRYNTSLSLTNAFHTIATPRGYELASIWMTGFAPAIDPAGNVYVVTGNGGFNNPGENYGESVLKLSPDLAEPPLGRFTPGSWSPLNQGDIDFGSGGVMLLPPAAASAPTLAAAMGKSAVLYLFNTNRLSASLQALTLGSSGSGLWGGPAYYSGPTGPTVFAQINGDVLRAFKVGAGAAPKLKASVTGSTGAGYGGSLPIVSSNGALAHTGVVWLIRRSDPVEIEAYDAQTLGDPIFSANIGVWSNPRDENPFLTPMEANGRVYAPNYKSVSVFGLTP